MNGELGVWHIWLFVVAVFAAGGAWALQQYHLRQVRKKQEEHDSKIDVLSRKVDGLIILSIDDGRHAAALAGLMTRNSPFKISDGRRVIEEFGSAPDLTLAAEQVLANGPLPENDAEMMDRVLKYTTFERLLERSMEVKRPLKVYMALWFDLLREVKELPGGYKQLKEELGIVD